MRTNQQDAQISVINFIFPLDALHVSEYVCMYEKPRLVYVK